MPVAGHQHRGRTMAEQRVTRKLAAILAADMVGYARLMEADEVGTITRLRAIRKELIDPKRSWKTVSQDPTASTRDGSTEVSP